MGRLTYSSHRISTDPFDIKTYVSVLMPALIMIEAWLFALCEVMVASTADV